jgi:hypothetical protein
MASGAMLIKQLSAIGQGRTRPEHQGNQTSQQRGAQPAPTGNQERHAGLGESGISLQTRQTR